MSLASGEAAAPGHKTCVVPGDDMVQTPPPGLGPQRLDEDPASVEGDRCLRLTAAPLTVRKTVNGDANGINAARSK